MYVYFSNKQVFVYSPLSLVSQFECIFGLPKATSLNLFLSSPFPSLNLFLSSPFPSLNPLLSPPSQQVNPFWWAPLLPAPPLSPYLRIRSASWRAS